MTSDSSRRPSRQASPWLVRGAVLALLPLAGCMQSEKTADMAAANAKAAMAAQNSTTLSASDTLFFDQAARAGMAEVQEGQVAQQQARRSAVREFGGQMVTEHGMVNDQLMALAQQKKVTPPSEPSDYQKTELTQLKAMKGSAFDKAYLDAQVVDHQDVLRVFRTEAESGTDPDVKAFAARYAPTIEQHLEMVQKLGGHASNS